MSKKVPKLAVGACACPIKDCRETVDVFKYQGGGGGDEKRRRFAGRLYCMCPKHGRIENQEFLLEHVKWLGDKAPSAPPVVTPRRPPPPRAAALVKKTAPPPKPAPPPAAPKTSSWLTDYSK